MKKLKTLILFVLCNHFLSNYFGTGFRPQKKTVDFISKYLFGSVNLKTGKTLFETDKWAVMSYLNVEYTTTIGRRPEILGTPYRYNSYQTKPLKLLVPTIGLNINYKL